MAATVEEAIMTLLTLSLPDEQGTLGGLHDSHYGNSSSKGSQVEYSDVAAFTLNLERDTKSIIRLESLLGEAKEMLGIVYSYRACVKALPQLPEGPDKTKSELYWETFKVVDAEMAKLRNLQQWQVKACRQLASDLGGEWRGGNGPSWSHMWCLVKLMDSLLILDFIKNFKTSFTNDFMWYKRTYPLTNQAKDESGDKKPNEGLQAFLTARWTILNTLKREIVRTDSVEETLIQLLGFCMENLEGEHTISYKDRLTLLRTLPLLLVLVAPTDKDGEGIFRKKVKLERVLQPLKREPVVSVFEEIYMVPAAIILDLSPYFRKLVEEEKIGLPLLDSLDKTEAATFYGILPNLPAIQEAHDGFCLRFSAVNSKLKMVIESPAKPGVDSVIGTVRVQNFGSTLAQEALSVTLDGMRLLNSWTGKLVQHFAWKCSHPLRPEDASVFAGNVQKGERGEKGEEGEKIPVSSYERALRFNLKQGEKRAILDLLVLIKGVGGIMSSNGSLFQQAVREAIHGEVQEFIRTPLSALLKKHVKKGKNEIVGMLLHVRAIVADWMGGSDHPSIPRKAKSRMGTSTPVANDLEHLTPIMPRLVAPSPAQIHSVLHVIQTLLLPSSSPEVGSFFTEGDPSYNEFHSLYYFLRRLLIFPAVLDYHGTLAEATSVGFLWFREWYLELNRVLQFPIECSVPWMLMSCLLDEERNPPETPLIDALLTPLSIYNDAANSSLHVLRQQFLYDEVEAEVELCFSQLVLKLSDRIYSHYKARAASALLDKSFFSVASAQSLQSSLRVFPHYFEGLLGKMSVQLIGRNISVSSLLTQRLNKVVRKNLYNILESLEAHDLCMVVGIEQQLEVLRVTHQHLAEHLPLDSFSTMLMEASNATSLVSFSSSIASYVMRDIEQDLLPNFIYNSTTQRFVRKKGETSKTVNRRTPSKVEDALLFGTKDLNQAYEAHALLFSSFFGLSHAHALVSLLGTHSLPLVIQRTLNILTTRIVPTVGSNVESLLPSVPKRFTLPIFESTVENCLNLVSSQHSPILKDSRLPIVVSCLRDTGSILAFLSLLDCALRDMETVQVIQSAPWLGVYPTEHGQLQQFPSERERERESEQDGERERERESESHPPSDPTPAPFGELLQKAATGTPSSGLELFGILQAAQVAEAMYWSGDQGESVFTHTLTVLGSSLSSLKEKWAHPEADSNSTAVQFHSLFSAIQLVSCCGSETVSSDKAGFDSLFLGGCTFLYLLGLDKLFELHDYCYNILHMEDYVASMGIEEKEEREGRDRGGNRSRPLSSQGSKDIGAFLSRARRVKSLNSHTVSMLKAHWPQPPCPAYVINAQGTKTSTTYPQLSLQPPDGSTL